MDSSPYDLERFAADPGAAVVVDWLDEQGRAVERAQAVEVRLKKLIGRGWLTVRLGIARAESLGFVRADASRAA